MRNRGYLRPFGFALFLIVAGLAVEYLFVALASVYVLATLVGAQNLQLVIGAISATSAVASTSVVFLLYRNSVRGANITIALEDPLKIKAQPFSRNIDGEFYEQMILSIPFLFSNSGARGGAVIGLDIVMIKPGKTIPTIMDGVASTDRIELFWNVGELGWKPLAIKDNETVAVIAGFDLRLKEQDSRNRPPSNRFVDIQNKEPYFVFKVAYRVTDGRGRIVSRDKLIQIRPEFVS